MKKGIFKAITLATLCLSMASCGMGTSGSSTSANLGGTASQVLMPTAAWLAVCWEALSQATQAVPDSCSTY